MFKRFLPQIIAMLFLAGFVAWAWTEPTSAPPSGNAPTPINVGPTAQTKQGDLLLNGNFKVSGDIIDKAGNTIYDSVTGKIERARLPF
jgi:hypothetical protein